MHAWIIVIEEINVGKLKKMEITFMEKKNKADKMSFYSSLITTAAMGEESEPFGLEIKKKKREHRCYKEYLVFIYRK